MPEMSPITVVAVDDDRMSLSVVEAALENQGLEVVATTEPERAVEIVQRRRPHIVLTDLVMPKMTGMELLERIVEIDPGIEVILLTAHYSTESAVEAIRKGACDYLNKPVSVPVLRERVARVARLLARPRTRWDSSNSPTRACCFSMRLAICHCHCRPRCCASSRTRRSSAWARRYREK